MIAPDQQQLLARRAIPSQRIVVDAAIADVHPVHDAIPYGRAALDNPPAHSAYVVTGSYFINNFNLFGRTWQVNLESEAVDRRDVPDLWKIYIRNSKGTVPLQ